MLTEPFLNDTNALMEFMRGIIAFNEHDLWITLKSFTYLRYQMRKAERIYLLAFLSGLVTLYGENQFLNFVDHSSKKALELSGGMNSTLALRSAILIEKGEYKKGIEMLIPLTKLRNEKSDCYILDTALNPSFS